MSLTATREARGARHTCQACTDRKARYRGRVYADRDHTLCFECFRAQRDRQRVEGPGWPRLRPHEGRLASLLTSRQIAHRRRMLDHLAGVTVVRPQTAQGS
jgi:hypothetical protein